ncbi:MAG TPA: hypothetical protein VHH73_17580, partial [Verrucomicrobiae bacterium]|nr:hypothetical protein [Verrucomicrobiae bacterium]
DRHRHRAHPWDRRLALEILLAPRIFQPPRKRDLFNRLLGMMCSWGLLLSGVTGLMDLEGRSISKSEEHKRLLQMLLFGTGFWIALCVIRNWRTRPEERRLLLAGVFLGTATLVFALITLKITDHFS